MDNLLYIWNRARELKGEDKAWDIIAREEGYPEFVNAVASSPLTTERIYFREAGRVGDLACWNNEIASFPSSSSLLALIPTRLNGIVNPYNPLEIICEPFNFRVEAQEIIEIREISSLFYVAYIRKEDLGVGELAEMIEGMSVS